MKDRFKKAVAKIGRIVKIKTNSGTFVGRAVIYPIRNRKTSNGDIQNVYEGVSEPERYVMFCDKNLVKAAEKRDTVICEGTSYLILWKDEFSCRAGSYMQIYLKKVIVGE